MVRKGYIESEGASSDICEDLFLINGDKYLINIDRLGECTDLDVFAADDTYIIKSAKHQIGIIGESGSYRINGNEIVGDDTYTPPVSAFNTLYGDTEIIFSQFGYETEYSTTADQETIKLRLNKISGDPYETIRTLAAATPPKQEEIHLVEESAADRNVNAEEPAAVPRPDGSVSGGTAAAEETESLPPEIQKIIDERPEETTKAKEAVKVERVPENADDLTEEEFDRIWEQTKAELADVYIDSPAPVGQKSYEERAENFIAYAPMAGAIYYDEISLVNDNGDVFIEAEFGPDWSDQEGNIENEQSKAYYRGLPAVVEKTIKELIGESEGQQFYTYLKEHADKMVQGGYVSLHNENNVLVSEWTDGYVGDGIRASELDLSDWQSRRTDAGLRYSVSRKGEGFRITVYKK